MSISRGWLAEALRDVSKEKARRLDESIWSLRDKPDRRPKLKALEREKQKAELLYCWSVGTMTGTKL